MNSKQIAQKSVFDICRFDKVESESINSIQRGLSMKRSQRCWLVIFCAVSFLLLSNCAVHDRVLFSNSNGSGEIGILVDGKIDGVDENDKSYTTTFNGHVDPGDVTSGSNNEVIAYQQERPVALVESAGWTAGDEDVNVAFANEMGTHFYVWILEAPYEDHRLRAIAACVKLVQVWEDERMGCQIATFDITDATSDPDRSSYLDYTCSEASNLRSEIGYNNNGVNIYYVDRVDFGSGFSTSNGVWCGSNTIVMGSSTSDHLAAHEVGHAFALSHVNNLTTNFDATNVMHNASNSREYLTEGQTFRAHFEPSSVINTTYNLRPGLTTRDCGDLSETATAGCPAIQKRIWADGTFPSN